MAKPEHRAVIFGPGGAGQAVMNAFADTGRAECVGFVEKSPKRRAELAKAYPDALVCEETELARVLAEAKPDLFVDAGPDHLHGPNTILALQHGCHVLIEKPMCTCIGDAKAIVAAERKTGKVVTVDYTMRYSHPWGTMMEAAKAGRVGEIFYVGGAYIHDMWDIYNPSGSEYTAWRSDPEHPQNILFGGGVHPLDMILVIMDDVPVTSVHCAANDLAQSGLPDNDLYILTMTFANGALGKIFVSAGCNGWDFGKMLEVYGREGTLYDGKLYRRYKDPEELPQPAEKSRMGHSWINTVVDFLDAVDGVKPNEMNTTFAARNVAICDAAMKSIASGHVEKVDWFV